MSCDLNFDMDYVRSVQGTWDFNSEQDYISTLAQENLAQGFEHAIGYDPHSKRNGITQPLIITASEVKYKYNISAMPGHDLFPGDVIESHGEHFIVINTRAISATYTLGLAWLCNVKIRFQNFTPEIIERYAVLDSGVYSTTTGEDSTLAYMKRQYKIYLPSDDDTDKIYIDKRLAVGTMYDQSGNIILEAYEITGRSKVARNYGTGAHLLELSAKSSEAVNARDNIEEMICDYISPEEYDGSDSGCNMCPSSECRIKGRTTARLGETRSYTLLFGESDVAPEDAGEFQWSVYPTEGVTLDGDGINCKIAIDDNENYLGENYLLSVVDSTNAYSASIEVEVV